MVIRAATPADAEAIGRMHSASWREAYWSMLPEDFFSDQGEAARIDGRRRILAASSDATVLRIAAEGDEVVGFGVPAELWVFEAKPARSRLPRGSGDSSRTAPVTSSAPR